MELIPIIYTVLEIVVVLTLLTLSISYISYKTKQRRVGKVSESKDTSDLLQPILKVETSAKKPIETGSNQKPKEAVKEKLVTVGKKEKHNKNASQKESSKRKVELKEKSPKIQNERLSILKNLSNSPSRENITTESKSKTVKESTRSLGEDILNSYIEEDDNEMFTLKVNKPIEKPKDI